MNNKIYELDDNFKVFGCQSSIYKISGKEELIVKIFSSKYDSLKKAENEFKIGKLFKINNISVPKYIGICRVSKKNESKIYNAVVIENIKDSYLIKNCAKYNDMWKVPSNMLNRGRDLLKTEIKKIEHLPFKLVSTGYSFGLDYQGLYSPSKDCIYLIDFGQMNYIKNSSSIG